MKTVVIDAPPEAIMDALADIEEPCRPGRRFTSTPRVIDAYEADGRPHHVKVTAPS